MSEGETEKLSKNSRDDNTATATQKATPEGKAGQDGSNTKKKRQRRQGPA